MTTWALWDAYDEDLRRRCLWEAREEHGSARIGSGLRRVRKLDEFQGRITVIPGATNDRAVIKKAVAGCDGVLIVLIPWGVPLYSSGTAQAVLDHARPGARFVLFYGWRITRDGKDVYSRTFKWTMGASGWLERLFRYRDLDDHVEACRRVFASDTRWTFVRGSALEEGESQGRPTVQGIGLRAYRAEARELLNHYPC